MDRILLTSDDIMSVFKWRDDNKPLVRLMPPAKRAVCIECKESGLRIIGVRKENNVEIGVFQEYRKLGRIVFRIVENGLVKVKGDGDPDNELYQDSTGLYCALMALMAFGAARTRETDTEQYSHAYNANRIATKRQYDDKRKNATYIIRYNGSVPTVKISGSHASPHGEFSVRGHYRHYKSGRVVWISEYRKGDGKKKPKIYKVGDMNEQ